MKIGILGGSFNPLHNGHLALAQAAYYQLQLDEVWFAPSGNHPLKREKLLPLEERLDLLEQALDNFPDFRISLADTDSDKLSYSDQLVNKLLKKYPEHDFFFLVGQDILSELHNWHNYKWLLDHVKLCVFTRMGNFPEHHLTNEE
ncbi:MAG: nicotinate (nicotinamide) nucleotide adenylyltransferase, partial [Candidatus Cloacimonetes bacterium]|nr:nicotinate (nicotinamide) nucleotide adenylyltransferase [Candidatus Cloacimonadota bacterium]